MGIILDSGQHQAGHWSHRLKCLEHPPDVTSLALVTLVTPIELFSLSATHKSNNPSIQLELISEIHSYDLTVQCPMAQVLSCYQALFSACATASHKSQSCRSLAPSLQLWTHFQLWQPPWIQLNLYSCCLDSRWPPAHL